MIKTKGFFITFEGGEASGKTTQIKKLKNWLQKNKIPSLITREPGGTKIAEYLRKIILSKKENVSINMEVLLLMTSRLDHLNKIIIPALNNNKIVICDRYVDSTAIYQGYYNKFGVQKIYQLHKLLLNNFLPDLTFVFNNNPNIAKKRLLKRKNKNKYDKVDYKFNNKINSAFIKLAKKNSRFIIIDATLSINEIHDIIISYLINKKSLNEFKKSKYNKWIFRK